MDVLQLPNTNKPEAYKLWSDLRDMFCDLVSYFALYDYFQCMQYGGSAVTVSLTVNEQVVYVHVSCVIWYW